MAMLVVGLGQVGRALRNLLSAAYHVVGTDLDIPIAPQLFDTLHICIPYTASFIDQVHEYKTRYLAPQGLCIIHSTVPVGTSWQCGAVYSPIRGIHPHLEESVLTFVKYFGGDRAAEAAQLFRQLGVPTQVVPDAETVEALKLWDTTIYAWNIVLEKAIHAYCGKLGLDFDVVYMQANQSYNDGYKKLGHPEYTKYVLKHVEGKIGGHCLMPNAELLTSWVADVIKWAEQSQT